MVKTKSVQMSEEKIFVPTATISLDEYDLLRKKANDYDSLKKQVALFPNILQSHMSAVLSRTVDHFFPEANYSKKRKLNSPIPIRVDVDMWIKNNGIYSMDLQIDEPNSGGYYKAKIVTHYTNQDHEKETNP